MKALTLVRPWPYAIFWLGKDIENRTWPTPEQILGKKIAIHAGKRFEKGDAERIPKIFFSNGFTASAMYALKEDIEHEPYAPGTIVGVVSVVGCFPVHDMETLQGKSRWAFGPWCWVLENPVRLTTPIPCKGKLSLWNVPGKIEEQIVVQLGRKTLLF